MPCDSCAPSTDAAFGRPTYGPSRDNPFSYNSGRAGRIEVGELAKPLYAGRDASPYSSATSPYPTSTASFGSPLAETSTDYEGSSLFPDGLVPVAEAGKAVVREPRYRDSHPVTRAAAKAWPTVTAALNDHFAKEEGAYSTFEGVSLGAMDPAYVLSWNPETGAVQVAEILGLYEPGTKRLSLSKALPPTAQGVLPVLGHEAVHDFDARRGYIAACLDRYGEARGRARVEDHAYDLAGALFGEPQLRHRQAANPSPD